MTRRRQGSAATGRDCPAVACGEIRLLGAAAFVAE